MSENPSGHFRDDDEAADAAAEHLLEQEEKAWRAYQAALEHPTDRHRAAEIYAETLNDDLCIYCKENVKEPDLDCCSTSHCHGLYLRDKAEAEQG